MKSTILHQDTVQIQREQSRLKQGQVALQAILDAFNSKEGLFKIESIDQLFGFLKDGEKFIRARIAEILPPEENGFKIDTVKKAELVVLPNMDDIEAIKPKIPQSADSRDFSPLIRREEYEIKKGAVLITEEAERSVYDINTIAASNELEQELVEAHRAASDALDAFIKLQAKGYGQPLVGIPGLEIKDLFKVDKEIPSVTMNGRYYLKMKVNGYLKRETQEK